MREIIVFPELPLTGAEPVIPAPAPTFKIYCGLCKIYYELKPVPFFRYGNLVLQKNT